MYANGFNIGQKYEGTVLWFNENFGYGFVETPEIRIEGTNSFFVHYSKIQSEEGFKALSKGAIVTFELAKTIKGIQCVNVREIKVVQAKVV